MVSRLKQRGKQLLVEFPADTLGPHAGRRKDPDGPGIFRGHQRLGQGREGRQEAAGAMSIQSAPFNFQDSFRDLMHDVSAPLRAPV